jgi:hypothetical protein
MADESEFSSLCLQITPPNISLGSQCLHEEGKNNIYYNIFYESKSTYPLNILRSRYINSDWLFQELYVFQALRFYFIPHMFEFIQMNFLPNLKISYFKKQNTIIIFLDGVNVIFRQNDSLVHNNQGCIYDFFKTVNILHEKLYNNVFETYCNLPTIDQNIIVLIIGLFEFIRFKNGGD